MRLKLYKGTIASFKKNNFFLAKPKIVFDNTTQGETAWLFHPALYTRSR